MRAPHGIMKALPAQHLELRQSTNTKFELT